MSSQPLDQESQEEGRPSRADRRAAVSTGFIRDWVNRLDDEWLPGFQGSPEQTFLVLHAVYRFLRERHGQEVNFIFWADLPDPQQVHAAEVMRVVDNTLNQILDQSLKHGASLLKAYARASSVLTLEPLQVMELGLARSVLERLERWKRLRELPLNEDTYEAWMTLLALGERMHEQVHQLQAISTLALEGSESGERAPVMIGARLADSTVALSVPLMRRGHLAPALAADIAQATQEQRLAREVFEREGRAQSWAMLTELVPSPLLYQGLNFRYDECAMLRPLIWPPQDGEQKKSGRLRYMPGTHYKRHTEGRSAQAMATQYNKAAALLVMPGVALARLPEELQAEWQQWADSIEMLKNGIGDAAGVVNILYGNIGEVHLPQTLGAEGPDESMAPEEYQQWLVASEGPSPEEQARLWMNEPHVLRRAGSRGVLRVPFPELLQERVQAAGVAITEQRTYCVVCHRTKSSRHYCYRHDDDSPQTRQEIKEAGGKPPQVEALLQSHRQRALKAWVASYLSNRQPQRPMGGAWGSLGLGHAIYASYSFVPDISPLRDVFSAAQHGERALNDIQAFLALGESGPAASAWWQALQGLRKVVTPQEMPAHSVAPQRWMTTITALVQAAALVRDVTRLVEHLRIDPELAREHGVGTDAGARLLGDYLRNYMLHLVFVLDAGSEASDSYAPTIPSPLHRHFFKLWFTGGSWWSLNARHQLQVDEHDGGPRALEGEFDPIAVVQQVERWAMWVAVNAKPSKGRNARYNAMETVVELKQRGMSTPQIAAELDITTKAVRMALMRHERRQAELAAGIVPRGRGRPRKASA